MQATDSKKKRFRQRKRQFKWLNATWFLEEEKIAEKTCWLYNMNSIQISIQAAREII